MKHFLTFLSLFILQVTLAQSWFPQGASWYYSEVYFSPTNVAEGFMHFQIAGDSVIQGKTCSKLIKNGQLQCLGRPSVEYLYEENDIVYAFNENEQAFQILYDFSLSTGGTWIVHPYQEVTNHDSLQVTVDSTDFVQINSIQLKRMYLTYTLLSDDELLDGYIYHAVAVEKIGDLRYLFNYGPTMSFSCDFNETNGLRCYEDSDFGLYETGSAPYCNYIAYTGIDELIDVEIQLFPNPTNGKFSIELTGFNTGKAVITNARGQIIEAIQFVSTNKLNFELIGDRGIYFVRLQGINGVKTIRLIKL